ncbi:MAG: methylmalonyl Co-A mutase-associated GTPase MeaB [Rhodobacteraceae bacterium]|jgi:LAO/AO transport system kinase|nr:methylmalonyl Co-A mutase-associated GTPase MeaB [Paracoccaceae bacterium]
MDLSARRQLATALTRVENQSGNWREILRACIRQAGDALVIGVTGPPGAGKSTLVDALAVHWASQGEMVAVLAIDPASPFSGGAVLGDRVRMTRSEGNDRIFIRSMSARGHSGGLNAAALDLCTVMAGHGASRILIETVGVGQNEVEVAFVADCTLVVSVPGLGDSVQAAKAGLLEVGDIYIVNKGDLPGAPAVARDLSNMLALVFPGLPGASHSQADRSMMVSIPGATRKLLSARYGAPDDPGGSWHPPVIAVSALNGQAIGELAGWFSAFESWLRHSPAGDRRRRERVRLQLVTLLKQRLFDRLQSRHGDDPATALSEWIAPVLSGKLDVHAATDQILQDKGPPHAQ